jgi:hypothetical protein
MAPFASPLEEKGKKGEGRETRGKEIYTLFSLQKYIVRCSSIGLFVHFFSILSSPHFPLVINLITAPSSVFL